MPEEAAPRYEVVVVDRWYDEYHVRDNKTGAKSSRTRPRLIMQAYADQLNAGELRFHNFAWIMPNGARIARRP